MAEPSSPKGTPGKKRKTAEPRHDSSARARKGGKDPAHQSSDAWHPAFLATLKTSGNIAYSAKQAGVSRQTFYAARKGDPAFAAQFQDAMDEAVDGLRLAGWTRALTTSDRLLEFMLRAHAPEFKDIDRPRVTVPITFQSDYDGLVARLNKIKARVSVPTGTGAPSVNGAAHNGAGT